MYRATGDTVYLDKLIEQFDRVLANRDDIKSLKDFYRKASLAGWGTSEYSKGKWHVWTVHTGMILQGPADFVQLVYAESALRKKYLKKADDYLIKIKESIAAHEPDWRHGPTSDEGYYVDPKIGPLPLNQQNALGSVFVSLYQATKDHYYRDKAAQLARYYKNRLRTTMDGSYVWSYWPKLDRLGTGSEDISHAAINVNFAVRCYTQKIVLGLNDMERFVRTWKNHIRRSAHEFTDDVDGNKVINTHSPQAVGRWMDLSIIQHDMLPDAVSAYDELPDNRFNGAEMLGIAKIARYTTSFAKPKPHILPKIKLFKKRTAHSRFTEQDLET